MSDAAPAAPCEPPLHPKQAVTEMARVLAPGGRAVIADGTSDRLLARVADRILRRLDQSHIRLYRSEELVELLTEAGFEGVAVRGLWDGGYAIVSGRRADGS